MENINYSVIIRTTGNAHLKYQKLLDSISRLEPQPQEVLVVLPEGNELPEEQLGWETFLFCPKGMVRQRMEGINACKTAYALICDDDICFPVDFVKKLHSPLKEGRGFFSVAPLYSFLPDKGINTFICAIMGSAMPMVMHRRTRYVSVLKSTGYSYNRYLERCPGRYYETQSAAWTCFYADIQVLKQLEFDQETWLDANGYSAYDDLTMFYKAWLMGFKTIVVANAAYEHLDARTSTSNNKPNVLFSRSFNRLVFWHRFIYSQQSRLLGKTLSQFAYCYRLIWIVVQNVTKVLRRRMTIHDLHICYNGFRAAKAYVQSDAYRRLPPIVRG